MPLPHLGQKGKFCRTVYFRDPNGHILELLTRDYTAEHLAQTAQR